MCITLLCEENLLQLCHLSILGYILLTIIWKPPAIVAGLLGSQIFKLAQWGVNLAQRRLHFYKSIHSLRRNFKTPHKSRVMSSDGSFHFYGSRRRRRISEFLTKKVNQGSTLMDKPRQPGTLRINGALKSYLFFRQSGSRVIIGNRNQSFRRLNESVPWEHLEQPLERAIKRA